MQSLFDSHPQVFMIPTIFEYPDLYEKLESQTIETVTQTVSNHFSIILKKKKTTIHGDFSNFEISASVFKNTLEELYDPINSTGRDFVYSVHEAFAAATNAQLDQKRILFIHVHNLSESSWADRVKSDFPNAKYIYMVRRPAQMIYSFVNSHLRFLNISLYQSCVPFMLTLEYLEEFPPIISNMIRLAGSSRITRLEYLHQNFENEVYSVAEFAGIGPIPILLESTFGGTPLIYSSPNNRNLAGRNPGVVAPNYKDAFSNDELRFLETVFKEYMQHCGYSFETAADFQLEEAIQLFGNKKLISRYHPRFYFPVKTHHYKDAVAAKRELIIGNAWSAIMRPSNFKTYFILILDWLGLGSLLYSLATYKRNFKQFRMPGMIRMFGQLDDPSSRIQLLKSLFK